MTWHPTTNRIQTVHLTPEERAALEAWPHGWELFYVNRWISIDSPRWNKDAVYQGKTPTVVTSVWKSIYSDELGFTSRQAEDNACHPKRIGVLRIDTCNGVSTAHLEGLKDE